MTDTPFGTPVAAAPGPVPQQAVAPLQTPPRPAHPVHPYARVALFLLGYLLVAVVLSVFVTFVGIALDAVGLLKLPPIDESVVARGTEGIIEIIGRFMLPIAVVTGLYSIAYTWAFARLVDRRSLRSFGLGRRAGGFLQFWKGVGLAFVILLGVFLLSLSTGSIEVNGFARPATETSSVAGYLVGAIVAFLLVGIYEELMFRGYVLQVLSERAGRGASILVSSAVFALMHGANPGADLMGIVNIVAIGGLLAYLFYRSGALWMPIGFHTGWNFLLGYVFTLPVSGLPMRGILDVVEVGGPGGEPSRYGPESSIALTAALAVWAAWLLVRRAAARRSAR
jgi:membrane protease YdiL (CAAX protease family)